VSACGGGGSSTTAGSGSSGSSSGQPSQQSISYGLKTTGGKPEAADASLPPVEIGFLNQEGSVPTFAEQRKAEEGAETFINENLGGIEGHPIKVDYCAFTNEEGGQKCAAEFLNSGVEVAQLGQGVEGNEAYYKAIGTKFPTLIDVAVAGPDLTATNGFNYTAGGADVITGLAHGIINAGYKNVAIVSSANPAGKVVTNEVLVPQLEAAGTKATTVFIADSANQPEFTSALQAAGVANVEAIVLIPSGSEQCIYGYQGLKQLDVEAPVITTYSCYAPPVLESTGGGPEGWEMWGYADNPHIETTESKVYSDVMEAEGLGEAVNEGTSSMSFGDLLAVTKFGNEIGYSKLNAATWKEHITGFAGPAFMVPGRTECGKNSTFPAICGDTVVSSAYENGKWVSVLDYKVPSTE
jgi:branched-chain amino acid transport system substrate-binding protein